MKSVNDIKSIITYKNISSNYTTILENLLNKIRIQNEIKIDILNSDIKYRRMWDNTITNFKSNYYSDRGKWTDFILSAEKYTENNVIKINPISIQELYSSKLNISLLIFWRDIANNLNSDTVFKLQLKLSLIFTTENSKDDQNIVKVEQIRSIGSVKVYTNKNFDEALTYFKYSLELLENHYSSFYVKNIILAYNICYDDSILKNIKISDEVYNLINESQTSKKEMVNKSILKLNEKNLPVKNEVSNLIIKIPCIIFLNFKKSKKEIYNICKNRSGIYCLKNNVNNQIYIGQSKNLKNRLAYYYNLKKDYLKGRGNSKIYNAVLKQNLNNFSLLILEFCNIDHLDEKENYYIKELKPEYNILQYAKSFKGFRHSDETKLKISLANKGKKLSEETKLKISLARKRNIPSH